MPPGHFQSRCAQFTREELSPPPKPAAQPPLFSMPLLLQQPSQQQGLCPFTRASDGITQMAGYVPHVAVFPQQKLAEHFQKRGKQPPARASRVAAPPLGTNTHMGADVTSKQTISDGKPERKYFSVKQL